MAHKNFSFSHTFLLLLFLLLLSAFTCESRAPFACDPNNALTRNLPFCRVSLHIRDRVNDLIRRLTLQEKVRLLVNNAAPVDRLGIKGYEWWSEALHGVSNTGPGVTFGGAFPGATSFPQVITTAASFNASLWEAIGQVSKQDLEETYNVPFKGCVLEGRVASVMCSYNQVNGKPTCADSSLLHDTIRGQWRLNGYIVSDCDSVGVMFNDQHYTSTPEDAVAASIKAAIYTQGAIRSGKLNEADVNRALSNLLVVQMRLGMFDGPRQPYLNLGPKDVCTPAHQQLALEAARQGIVLLQNRNRALPLSTTRHRTVAVIGPNSDATDTMIGNYAGTPCGYTTPLQGISRYVRTIHDEGCRPVSCANNRQFGVAEMAARRADATVLVMGLSQMIEREALDRGGLLLPGHQQELVSRVARASRGPVILVLMSGGPIDVTFAKIDPKIAGIIWVGYPGQAGGTAIADVIFGTTNPGGKLPMTWYPQDYVAKVRMTDMAMHADPSRGYPGRTYRFYKGPVVFPYGYGLSYTSFRHILAHGPNTISVPFTSPTAFKNTTILSKAIRVSHTNCETLTLGVHIDVENIGEMDGTHTVMVFASAPAVGEKKLVAFEKVNVLVGTKQRVKVNIDVCDHLSIVDQFGIRRVPMGEHNLHIGDDLKHTILLQNAMEEIKS
ncbi:hypothetical protein BUALT_Bualt14G0123100 [Buddleja alternifolia]|uniref:Fibronectin type III-like domain-containing protein n=1 Tax=Buddleja alternifolia TaxID=168488 RepID=A0AAV6WIV7_9LAMI|nr:hypothetical protein BUALT_Bualt14G0123100 [Buddleja alternifolia]